MSQNALDLIFVIAIVVEAALILGGLVSGVSALGYILPVIVACTALTCLAIRDFFRQHR